MRSCSWGGCRGWAWRRPPCEADRWPRSDQLGPKNPTPLDTLLADDLSAIPAACPLPALALTKALDDLLWGRWDPWVGASARGGAAFAAALTRGVLEGG